MSLFTGANERFFIGDRYNTGTTVGIEFSGAGGPGADSASFSDLQSGIVTYNFATGALNLYDAAAPNTSLAFVDGSAGYTGFNFDNFRIFNDSGGDVVLIGISISSAAVPEPSTTAALLGMGTLAAFRLRRRLRR